MKTDNKLQENLRKLAGDHDLNGPPVEGEIEERLREPEENETDE